MSLNHYSRASSVLCFHSYQDSSHHLPSCLDAALHVARDHPDIVGVLAIPIGNKGRISAEKTFGSRLSGTDSDPE